MVFLNTYHWEVAAYDSCKNSSFGLCVSFLCLLIIKNCCGQALTCTWIAFRINYKLIFLLLCPANLHPWQISPSAPHGIIAFHSIDDEMNLYYITELFEEKMHKHDYQFELISLKGRKHDLGEGNEKYSGIFDKGILERTDEFLKRFDFMPQDDWSFHYYTPLNRT